MGGCTVQAVGLGLLRVWAYLGLWGGGEVNLIWKGGAYGMGG